MKNAILAISERKETLKQIRKELSEQYEIITFNNIVLNVNDSICKKYIFIHKIYTKLDTYYKKHDILISDRIKEKCHAKDIYCFNTHGNTIIKDYQKMDER